MEWRRRRPCFQSGHLLRFRVAVNLGGHLSTQSSHRHPRRAEGRVQLARGRHGAVLGLQLRLAWALPRPTLRQQSHRLHPVASASGWSWHSPVPSFDTHFLSICQAPSSGGAEGSEAGRVPPQGGWHPVTCCQRGEIRIPHDSWTIFFF